MNGTLCRKFEISKCDSGEVKHKEAEIHELECLASEEAVEHLGLSRQGDCIVEDLLVRNQTRIFFFGRKVFAPESENCIEDESRCYLKEGLIVWKAKQRDCMSRLTDALLSNDRIIVPRFQIAAEYGAQTENSICGRSRDTYSISPFLSFSVMHERPKRQPFQPIVKIIQSFKKKSKATATAAEGLLQTIKTKNSESKEEIEESPGTPGDGAQGLSSHFIQGNLCQTKL